MPIVLLFVALYVAVVAGGSYAVVRLLARRFPRLRVPAAAAALIVCGLAFTPVPIHGGFVFLLPELLSEGWRELRAEREEGVRERREERLASRFAGYLEGAALSGGWRDPASGLVWSETLQEVHAVDPESLAQAKGACAQREPKGYWALPRDAEFYLLSKAGRASGAWLAEGFLWPEEVSFPKLVRFEGAPRPQVRCVAVTPPAPLRGYLSSDIPLEEWNRHELGLLAGGTGAAHP
jgi:hypothetical protein